MAISLREESPPTTKKPLASMRDPEKDGNHIEKRPLIGRDDGSEGRGDLS
jgi:hypothetical protein